MPDKPPRDPRTKGSTIHLTTVTTKIGDQGQTALGDRTKTAKYDIRVQAYGSVDEANCFIGQAIVTLDEVGSHPHLAGEVTVETVEAMRRVLRQIQNDLFDVGADLSTPLNSSGEPKRPGSDLHRIDEADVGRLEEASQQFSGLTQPIHSFVLPGGSRLAADLHTARSITRRAERDVWAAANQYPDVNREAARYLNRLSDLLFILSRVANLGMTETFWIPQDRERPDL